ncbi:hypothetical protein ACCO45_003903 [Purpureocillium lilacinum]|uniref:Uncharacterized protein n=1 Tax=Purpureocillium lilacinum TaxID=33203 RepID=A0ACC4E184_PURLI
MYPRVIALRAWRWCHRLISPVTPKRRISVHCNGPGRPSARSSLREAAARQRHARGKTCKGREKYDNTPGRRQSEGLQRHGGAGARLRGRVAPVAGVTQRRGVLLSRRAIIGRPPMYEVCCCVAAPLDMSTHVIASRFLFQGAYVWVPAGAARWLAGRFSSLRPPGRLKVSNVIIRTQDEQRGPTLVGERRDDKANKTNGAEKREPPGQG